jgi:division protein CdvB (Snf7/Vps24/ESCRT-III family)
MPSLVAEIGDAIDSHMRMIGMIQDEDLDEHQQKLIDQKRREFEDHSQSANTVADTADEPPAFPPEARLCLKCQTKATVLLDGCMTCLNCGDSKCG